MAQFHIWLLHRGTPSSQNELAPYYQRQMSDSFLLGLGRSWFSKIWIQWLSFWRKKQFPTLCLVDSTKETEQQAQELGRVLGTDYQCSVVYRYYGKTAAERIKELPKKQTVLLLSLEPFQTEVFHSMLAASRSVLEQNQYQYIEAPPLYRSPLFIDAYVESIRHQIIEAKLNHHNYAIALFWSPDAKNWNHLHHDFEKELFLFVEAIKEKLHTSIPVLVLPNQASAKNELATLSNCQDVFYSFPNWLCHPFEQLHSSLTSSSFQFHPISPMNTQASFIRTLAEIIWKETNNHPST